MLPSRFWTLERLFLLDLILPALFTAAAMYDSYREFDSVTRSLAWALTDFRVQAPIRFWPRCL